MLIFNGLNIWSDCFVPIENCPYTNTVIPGHCSKYLNDNTKARYIDANQSNSYVAQNGSKQVRAQIDTYEMLKNKIS